MDAVSDSGDLGQGVLGASVGQVLAGSGSTNKEYFGQLSAVLSELVNGQARIETKLDIALAKSSDAALPRPVQKVESSSVLRGASDGAGMVVELSSSGGENEQVSARSLWPRSIKIHPALVGAVEPSRGPIVRVSAIRHGGNPKNHMTMRSSISGQSIRDRHRVVDPSSVHVLIFDLVGVIVLLYDILTASYAVALDVSLSKSFVVLNTLSFLYWTADFIMRFFLGYYCHGELIMKPRRIRQHYLRTWCAPNLVLLIFDVAGILLAAIAVGNVEKLRLLRAVRLLRAPHLKRTMDKLSTVGLSPTQNLVLRGLNVIVALLAYNHFMCCVWCMLGRWSQSTGPSWLDCVDTGVVDGTMTTGAIHTMNPFSIYIIGLHWTLAQMTPGPMGVSPASHVERSFNIVMLVVGVLLASLIVSMFSGQIMQIVIKRREVSHQMEVVRRFLRSHGIRPSVASRVIRQCGQRLTNTDLTPALKDVAAFQVLSLDVRTSLILEMGLTPLKSHELFKVWNDVDEADLQNLCVETVEINVVRSGEEVFLSRGHAEKAFCLMAGTINYTRVEGRRNFDSAVQCGTWLVEAALWSVWRHRGTACTTSLSHILNINAKSFHRFLDKGGTFAEIARQYGINYHRRIVQAVPPHSDYPNDLVVPFALPSSLLSFQVSLCLLEFADVTGDQLKKLREEISAEKCSLTRSGDNRELQRNVTLAVLEISAAIELQEHILVIVGKVENNRVASRMKLPGSKLATGDFQQDFVNTELGRLSPLLTDFEMKESNEIQELETSQRFGIPTMYHKAVFQYTCTPMLDSELEVHMPKEAWTACPVSTRHIFRLCEDLYMWLTPPEFEVLRKEEGQWAAWLGIVEDFVVADPNSASI